MKRDFLAASMSMSSTLSPCHNPFSFTTLRFREDDSVALISASSLSITSSLSSTFNVGPARICMENLLLKRAIPSPRQHFGNIGCDSIPSHRVRPYKNLRNSPNTQRYQERRQREPVPSYRSPQLSRKPSQEVEACQSRISTVLGFVSEAITVYSVSSRR